MAVVTIKSTQISNRDATPRVLNNSYLEGAMVRHARDVCVVANGDSVGSKYIFCTLPSNALVVSVRLSAPDIGTTTAADVGLYKTTQDGSAVVDADFFKAAQSLSGGAIAKAEVVNSNVMTVANSGKRLWELLGLASDPRILYDVALTLTGAADAAGSVLAEVDYTV